MLAADVPAYSIDLETAEAERWAEVTSRETAVVGRLLEEAGAEFARVPELARWIFARLYQATGGLYRDELAAWADALGVSPGTITILNCADEFSHLCCPNLFGCTAGARWVDGLGMVHVRTLDWPLPTMGDATRRFWFRRGTRQFVSVGVPGQVGVLSGMLPLAYSATINWAPPVAFPTFEFGPAFLLRDVLETCDSFDTAVARLTSTPLSTSAFFTVCGVEKDQACVIERTQRDAVVRSMTGPVLVQANHHVAARFQKNNEDLLEVAPGDEVFSLDGSTTRAEIMTRALSERESTTRPEEIARVLDTPSVLNSQTCQQMVFCPSTGDLHVWRRVRPDQSCLETDESH
jgi:acid ceramidase